MAILSGLLVEQENLVIDAHLKYGLKLVKTFHINGWSSVILCK
jgi:ribosomal protein L11 methylase PrmA